MSTENHAQTIAQLAVNQMPSASLVQVEDGRQFILRPNGLSSLEVKDITDYNKLAPNLPNHVSQNVELQDEASLILYANRFKNDDSMLFADMDTNSIKLAVDYHQQPIANRPVPPETPPQATADENVDTTVAKARLLHHTALLMLPYSEEWKTWTGISGIMKNQLDFVRFIEENAPDIVSPDAATLIEVCRDMQALRKVSYQKVVRAQSNNAESFEYVDETKANARGSVEIPTEFHLRMPVYFNGTPVEIKAFLRWHLDDGVLKLGIKLYRAESVRQTEFKSIVGSIAAATGLVTVYGDMNG